MLAKINRLKKGLDFERTFKKGKKFKEDFLILVTAKSSTDRTRFGFIVSQKVSKKAAVRNKIKRRFRELCRRRLKEIKKGLDIIIIAAPGLEVKDFWEVEEIINKLFKRAKCLKE